MYEWRLVPLGHVISIKHGYAFKGEYFSDEATGPILITPGNFAIGGGFKQARPKYYLGPIPDEFRLRAGDLILTMTDLSKSGDTLGYPAIVPSDREYLHNQRIGLVTIKVPDEIDINFLYYGMRTDDYRRHVMAGATGSTVRHTSPSRIAEYAILVPCLAEQQAIAAVLGALDDKIAVNDRIVRACDQLRTLRLSDWIQSEPDAISERPLSSIAEFVNGRAFTKGASGIGRLVVRIAEINSGPGAATIYSEIEVPDQHLARPGDVLFAWSGSLTVARWFRPEAIINQHIFKVIPNDGVPAWLVFELVQTKLAMFRSIAADKATTMGHIQRRHLDEPVTVPTASSLARLDAELGPLWDRALAAERESLTLAELRDALLPQLMSGEIRVRNAEKICEGAT